MTYWKRNQNVSRHLAACQLPQLEQVWKFSVSRDLQGLNCQIMQMLLIDICGISLIYYRLEAGPRFNINMSSCRYRKSHCGDKTVVRSSYLHNGISYTGKVSSLYWIGSQTGIMQHRAQSHKKQRNLTTAKLHILKQGKSEGFDSCDRPSNLKLDSNHQFFRPCDREIWWMTLQNNRTPLLC